MDRGDNARVQVPRARIAPLLVVLATAAACDERTTDYPDADAHEEEPADVGEDGCWNELETAEPEEQAALHGTYGEEGDLEFWIYEGVIQGDTVWPPATFVQLEIWPERGGPAEPGTYAVEEGPYSGCGLCVLVRESCVPEDGLALCERDYVAVSGAVEIEEMGRSGEMLSGSVADAYLVETVIDWDSGAFGSAPVDGGMTWCIGEMHFEVGVSTYPER